MRDYARRRARTVPEVEAHPMTESAPLIPNTPAPVRLLAEPVGVLRIGLLGKLAVTRDDGPVAMPPSRKLRGLLAYLVITPEGASRSHLCQLLWEVPNDPRGELRWCLSKLRSVLDDAGRARVLTHEDSVRLDLSDCFVDAIALSRFMTEEIDTASPARLSAIEASCAGEFLDSLEIDRSPAFGAWLTAQRRNFRRCRATLLEKLVQRLPSESVFGALERWVALEPFDVRAHARMLQALHQHGRLRDGEAHLATALRQFEAEGLDVGPLHLAWRAARGAPARDIELPAAAPMPARAAAPAPQRASIAVVSFADHSVGLAPHQGIADGLAHDLVTRLAGLRSLFVIAQGTMLALKERCASVEEAGRLLNVDYVVTGAVRGRGSRLAVTVELAEGRTGRVVWSDHFEHTGEEVQALPDTICNMIVANIAGEIEALERNRALLRPAGSLDAWQAHHRGLWHMYQHRQADNEAARRFFQDAVRLDPTFSRAYAGLSYTYYQDAFQQWAAREPSIAQAYRAASDALMADERDPAAHWAMGRALWLRAHRNEALCELGRAIELSPNFAHAHYSHAFVNCIAGDPAAAVESSDLSRQLSPFDPMLFGMYGTRALALVRQERFEEAAQAAVQAACRPNAFPHIHAIAACCLGLAGDPVRGRDHTAAARRIAPAYGLQDFFAAFPFDGDERTQFRRGAVEVGLAA
jgi:DNA-binding SARP family transcriptional activator/Flp pilus assembly protein TadD